MSPVPQLRQPLHLCGSSLSTTREFGGRPLPPPLPSPLTSGSSEGPGPVPPSGTQSRPSSASYLLQRGGPLLVGSADLPSRVDWKLPLGVAREEGPSLPSVLSRHPGYGRRRPHTPYAGPYLQSIPCTRPLSHCSEWATGSTWEGLWSCLGRERTHRSERRRSSRPGGRGGEEPGRALPPAKEGACVNPVLWMIRPRYTCAHLPVGVSRSLLEVCGHVRSGPSTSYL